jgi:outer membrane immunogenic protein
MKKLIAGTIVAAVLAMSAAANAADIAPVYKAPAPAPLWNGFYVGGYGAYSWADQGVRHNVICQPRDTCPVPAQNPGAQLFLDDVNRFHSVETFKTDKFTGGAYLGYNHQVGAWVLGLESDYTFLKTSASSAFTDRISTGFPIDIQRFQTSVDIDGVWTVRGRVGYAWGNLLTFVTGGFAAGNVGGLHTFTNEVPAGGTRLTIESGAANSKWAYGYVVGGGFDWALTQNWILRAEYQYIDLAGINFEGIVTFPALPPGNNPTYIHNIDTRVQFVRAGLAYKFDWGKSPVFAKY